MLKRVPSHDGTFYLSDAGGEDEAGDFVSEAGDAGFASVFGVSFDFVSPFSFPFT